MSLIVGRNSASDSLVSVAVDGDGRIMTVSDAAGGTQDVNVTNASLDVVDSAVASALAGTLSVADSAVSSALAGTLSVQDSAVASALASGIQTHTVADFQEVLLWSNDPLQENSMPTESPPFSPQGKAFIIGGSTTGPPYENDISIEFSHDAMTWFEDNDAYVSVSSNGKFSYKQPHAPAQYYRMVAIKNSGQPATISAVAMYVAESV